MAHPLIENGLRLPVHRVVLAGQDYKTAFNWQWVFGDGSKSWITILLHLSSAACGRLNLRFVCQGKNFDQTFDLVSMPCRFGGQRWFALCPHTGARASKLYSLGDVGFHARRRYRCTAYRSQRAPKRIDRVLMRRDRILLQKLKSNDPELPLKPKWMRWKTYERCVNQLEEMERQLDCYLAGLLHRVGGL